MFLNTAKYFKTLRCGCGAVAFIFSIYLKPVLYQAVNGLKRKKLVTVNSVCAFPPSDRSHAIHPGVILSRVIDKVLEEPRKQPFLRGRGRDAFAVLRLSKRTVKSRYLEL